MEKGQQERIRAYGRWSYRVPEINWLVSVAQHEGGGGGSILPLPFVTPSNLSLTPPNASLSFLDIF